MAKNNDTTLLLIAGAVILFNKDIKELFGGVTTAAEGLGGGVATAAGGLGEGIAEVGSGVGTGVGAAVEGLGTGVGILGSETGEAAGGVIGAGGSFFESLFEFGEGFVRGTGDIIQGVLTPAQNQEIAKTSRNLSVSTLKYKAGIVRRGTADLRLAETSISRFANTLQEGSTVTAVGSTLQSGAIGGFEVEFGFGGGGFGFSVPV